MFEFFLYIFVIKTFLKVSNQPGKAAGTFSITCQSFYLIDGVKAMTNILNLPGYNPCCGVANMLPPPQ